MTAPPEVQSAFNAAPAPLHPRLRELRALILAAAEATATAPLHETLKWGQPAYLPAKKDGTTIRLGWPKGSSDTCALYVHCQTDLVGRWRQLYPEAFTYESNRAVLIPATGPIEKAALQQMAGMAFTYHRKARA